MARTRDTYWRFQCPECGLGDHEVGHLVSRDDVYCVICFEEDARQVRLRKWEETEADHARLRVGLVAA
jgi:hypothetical protein